MKFRQILDNDWVGIFVLLLIGAFIVAAINLISGRDFGETFKYALVALAVIPVSVISTGLVVVFSLGKFDDNLVGVIWFLASVFVTIPASLTFAFSFL